MGQLTNFTEKKILDHVLKTASYSPPATVYLGLSTADPTHDGSGWANPTYTGYAMKPITFAAAGSRAIAQTPDNGDTVEWLDSQFSVSVQ
jgi:hypothetical protein